MPWSTPDPQPVEPVLGDPASVSALAAVLRRTATDIDAVLGRLSTGASQDRRHRRRLHDLQTRGRSLTVSMEGTGHRLADHAAELADALGLARRLVQRAEARGLVVDGAVVGRPHGVRGIADERTERARDETAQRLQHVLDTVLLDLDTRRRELGDELDSRRESGFDSGHGPRASR